MRPELRIDPVGPTDLLASGAANAKSGRGDSRAPGRDFAGVSRRYVSRFSEEPFQELFAGSRLLGVRPSERGRRKGFRGGDRL
jgi:hypothetical protein